MATGERRIGSARRGMTVLGKIPSVPKPINLPSQKLENRGLDPSVEIVPKGTFSWGAGRSPPTSGSSWGTVAPASSAPVTTGAWSVVSNPQIVSNTTSIAAGSLQNVSRPSSAGSTRPSTAGSTRPSTAHTTTSRAWASAAKEEQSQPNDFTLTSVDFPTLGSEKSQCLHAEHGNTTSSRPNSADTTKSRPSVFSETSLNRPTSADGTKERQSAYLYGRLHSELTSSADETFPDDMIHDSADSRRCGTAGPQMNSQIEANYAVYPFPHGILVPSHGFMIGSGAYPGPSIHSSSMSTAKLEEKGLSWNGAIYGGYPPNVVPQPFFGTSRASGIHYPAHKYPSQRTIGYVMQAYGTANVPFHGQAAKGIEKAQYYCSSEDYMEQKDGWNEQWIDQTQTDGNPSVEKIQTSKHFNNSFPSQKHENGQVSVNRLLTDITVAEMLPKASSPTQELVTFIEEVPDEKMCTNGNRVNKGHNVSKQILTRKVNRDKKEGPEGKIRHELEQELKSHEVISRSDSRMDDTITNDQKSSAAPAINVGVTLHDNKAGHLSEQNNFLDHSSNNHNSISGNKANFKKQNSGLSACSPTVDPISIVNGSPRSHQQGQSAGEAYETRETDMGPLAAYSSEVLVSDMATGIENSSINRIKKGGSMNVRKKTRQFFKTAKGAREAIHPQSSQDNESMMLENQMLEKNVTYPEDSSLQCVNQVDDSKGPKGGDFSREDITGVAKLTLDDSSKSLPSEKGQVGTRRKVKRKGHISRRSHGDQLHESHAWAPVKDCIPVLETKECCQYEGIEVKETLLENSRNQLQHQQYHSEVNRDYIKEGIKPSGTILATDMRQEQSLQMQPVVMHTNQQDKQANGSENIGNITRKQRNRKQQEEMSTHGEGEQWVQKNTFTRQNRKQRKQWQEMSSNKMKVEMVQEKYDSSVVQDTFGSGNLSEEIAVDTHLNTAGELKNHQQEASMFQQPQFLEEIKQGQNKVLLEDKGNISCSMTKSETYSINTRTKETGGPDDDPTLISEKIKRKNFILHAKKHSSKQNLQKQFADINNNASEIQGQKQDPKDTEQAIQLDFVSDIVRLNKKAETNVGIKKHLMREVAEKFQPGTTIRQESVHHDTKEVGRNFSDNANDNNKMDGHIVDITASARQKGKQQQRYDVERGKLTTQLITGSESNKDIPSSGDKSVDSEHTARRGNHASRNRRSKKRDETNPYVAKCQQTYHVKCDDNSMEVQGMHTEQSISREDIKIVGAGKASTHLHDSSKAHQFSYQVSSHQPAVDSSTGNMPDKEPKDGQQASSGKQASHVQKHVRTKIVDSVLNGSTAASGIQRWQPRHPQDQELSKAYVHMGRN